MSVLLPLWLTPAMQVLFEMTGQEAGELLDSDWKTFQDGNAFWGFTDESRGTG